MQVDFVLTSTDVRRLVGHMPMPKRKLFLLIAAVNAAGAAYSYAMRGPEHGLGSVRIFLFTAALFVACWLLFPRYLAWRISRGLDVVGPNRVTLTDDGLFHDDPGGRHHTLWSHVARVETTALDILVFHTDPAALPILIPMRAFPDDATRIAFLTDLRRRVPSIHA